MKQKIVYIVLLAVALYLPASSKECVKVFKHAVTEKLLQVKEKATDETAEINSMPASPFSGLLLKL